ncbi:MAG TPA: radical SAM protein [Vicinamibacteria bacterium]|nr:radical SAM protein [Vicinamibacteria bacterium]
MTTLIERVLRRPAAASTELLLPQTESADANLRLANEGDGRYDIVERGGRAAVTPEGWSQYLYFRLADGLRRGLTNGAVIEVDYFGREFATFRLQYASTDPGAPYGGLYKEAIQRWDGNRSAEPVWRRALFLIEDFDPDRFQNVGASFRMEIRQDFYVSRVAVHRELPVDALGSFPEIAPLPSIRKSPERVYPIWWLFVEITNLCNFHCTFCPDEIMERHRGMMPFEDAVKVFDQVARERHRLGPLYPVKLHQMGEPTIHPRLVDIVRYAEREKGIAIELNTNCSLLTPELVDGLYDAGLTNLILSYQTPDAESFLTRKAKSKKLTFDIYLEKVRMAVERKIAKAAPTRIEIDVMNTLGSSRIQIVGSNAKADRVMLEWIAFARSLERKYGLAPKKHDLNYVDGGFRFLEHDADTGRYEILPGVDILWKELHTWGNVIQGRTTSSKVDGYCPAPNEQFVILWDGTVTVCCTDYEGTLAMGNIHEQSIEEIWTGPKWRRMRQAMWQDVLESKTCRVCKGVEEPDLVQIQV